MDGLVDASKDPFVHCYECPMLFCGSPTDMVHHLTDACSGHCWPLAENIKYETCYPFTMLESLEDHCRLLVSEEDGSVFLLIAGTGEARADRRPISVVCVRGDAADADTDARPMYGCSWRDSKAVISQNPTTPSNKWPGKINGQATITSVCLFCKCGEECM